jgi:uncharacterized membrane protein YheB (UPF0754 family)
MTLTDKESDEPTETVSIITDSNLVVWLVLGNFIQAVKRSKKIGRFVVHPDAAAELEKWCREGSLKRKKFGLIVNDFARIAKELTTKEFDNIENAALQSAMETLNQSYAVLKRVGSELLSDPPSPQDLKQHACAILKNCKIATQERSLSAIASKVHNGMLLNFRTIIAAFIDEGLIDKKQLTDGLNNLGAYKENISAKDRAALLQKFNP